MINIVPFRSTHFSWFIFCSWQHSISWSVDMIEFPQRMKI